MGENNTVIIVIVTVAALAVVVFLFWKNQRDRKEINPDAQDRVDEQQMDQKRKDNSL